MISVAVIGRNDVLVSSSQLSEYVILGSFKESFPRPGELLIVISQCELTKEDSTPTRSDTYQTAVKVSETEEKFWQANFSELHTCFRIQLEGCLLSREQSCKLKGSQKLGGNITSRDNCPNYLEFRSTYGY